MITGNKNPSRLQSKHISIKFYEERHAKGYMDNWPIEKKERIFEIIRNLDLPSVGEALDFGCGTGFFTDVIKHALPAGWKVYGTDISSIAIEKAKNRYPECYFIFQNDIKYSGKKFDFLFTHHVLEHVYDLNNVLDDIDNYMKNKSAILHVLPCGNEGSFEYGLCKLRINGVNSQLGDRYFFEDEGHIRRLNTKSLCSLCLTKGFILNKEYYSNQFYGAIEFLTSYVPQFIFMLTDASFAIDKDSKKTLISLRCKLLLIWLLRFPAFFIDSRLHRKYRKPIDYIVMVLLLPMYLFTKPMDYYIKKKAREEWQIKKNDRNGSEMYLYFKR